MSEFPTIEQYDVVVIEENYWYYAEDFPADNYQQRNYHHIKLNVPVPEDCPDLEALIDSELRSYGYIH